MSCTVTAMPRPMSGNQLTKLGKRLAEPGPISDEDYELLAQVAEFYQAVTDTVQERLRSLGFEPTTRGFKSTGTMVDKLRRTHLSLKDIHDLGGARIVIDGGRLDQDRAVGRIMQAFEGCPKPPLKIDRREEPSHGYRAVHVIVYEESTPMEIQVRTKLQDTWAQISEKLGDIWGRGLRYGEGPDQPEAGVMLGSPTTRGEVVGRLLMFSEVIDGVEANEVTLSQLREEMFEPSPPSADTLERLAAIEESLVISKDQLQSGLDRLLEDIRQLGGAQ
jgi:Region found in RelA / SpoT proteins